MTPAGMTPPPRLAGTEHRWVDVEGARLHVAVAEGDDPAVLLVHGFPQHHWGFRHVLPLLDGRRVVLPDVRGAGWSQAPHGAYATRTLAEDLIHIVDRMTRTAVVAAGQGDGARVLLAAAARAPDRFARVVVLGAIPAPDPRIGLLFTGAAVRRGAPIRRHLAALAVDGDDERVYLEPLRDHHRAYAAVRRQRTLLLRERGASPEPPATVDVVRLDALPESAPDRVAAALLA